MINDAYSRMLNGLASYGTFSSDDESVSYLGMLRVCDMGVNTLRVEMANRVALHGEWRPRFEPNGNDANVEIVTFGYADPFTSETLIRKPGSGSPSRRSPRSNASSAACSPIRLSLERSLPSRRKRRASSARCASPQVGR